MGGGQATPCRETFELWWLEHWLWWRNCIWYTFELMVDSINTVWSGLYLITRYTGWYEFDNYTSWTIWVDNYNGKGVEIDCRRVYLPTLSALERSNWFGVSFAPAKHQMNQPWRFLLGKASTQILVFRWVGTKAARVDYLRCLVDALELAMTTEWIITSPLLSITSELKTNQPKLHAKSGRKIATPASRLGACSPTCTNQHVIYLLLHVGLHVAAATVNHGSTRALRPGAVLANSWTQRRGLTGGEGGRTRPALAV